jgi:hypothetical protein
MNQDKFNNFFADIMNASPFIKVGAEGKAGAGKTWTLALMSVGVHKRIKSEKPIVVFDTEKSAKFLRKLFEDNGIKGIVKESRTLSDLEATMDFCAQGGSDILIIDSITHVYEHFLEAYKASKSKNRGFLEMRDWSFIKPIWQKRFAEKLVDGPYHTFFTGREGYTYEQQVNEETNKKEYVKTGVKMRAGSDTAYEPDLLLWMQRVENVLADPPEIYRTATVIKGRGNLCDGMIIRNPTVDDFKPFIDYVLSNPVAPVVTKSYSDAGLFPEEQAFEDDRKDRKVMLERNEALINQVAAGSSGAAKSMKGSLLQYAYHGETSETKISEMTTPELEEGNRRLNDIVPLVKRVIDGEKYIYPLAKVIDAARAKHLGLEYTEDIVAAGLEKLTAYLAHITEKFVAQRDGAAEKAVSKKGAAGPKQSGGGASADSPLDEILRLMEEHGSALPSLRSNFPADLLRRMSTEELADVLNEVKDEIAKTQTGNGKPAEVASH